MTESIETSSKPRNKFLYAAEQELVAFERREREFRKKAGTGGRIANAAHQASVASQLTAIITCGERSLHEYIADLRAFLDKRWRGGLGRSA